MIILPKQLMLDPLDTYPYAQDMKVSEEDLKEFFQMCEKSLCVKSKCSAYATWSRRWKRDSYLPALFSRTLKPYRLKNFVEPWTSSAVASRANHSVLQDIVKELKTQDIYSPTSQKESESADPQLYFLKTSAESSVVEQEMENLWSNMSEEHWKKWVTDVRLDYSQRKKLVRAMHDKEYSSLQFPTPRSSDSEGGTVQAKMSKSGFYRENKQGVKWSVKLKDAVETMENNWATPNTMDMLPPREYDAMMKQATTTRKGRTGPSNLREQVDPTCNQAYRDANKKWATPTARDFKDSPNDKSGIAMTLGRQVNGWQRSQQDQTKNSTNGKNQELSNWATPRVGGQDENAETLEARGRSLTLNAQANYQKQERGYLNPNWVEQLMGLPVGWTQSSIAPIDSDYLGME